MPAAPSSPVVPVICHLLAAAESLGEDRATVLSVLAAVADPRARRGIRHRLAAILALAVCAVLAGARSVTAIAEWAVGAFGDQIGAWAQQCIPRQAGAGWWRQTARCYGGPAWPGEPGRHLLAALDHSQGWSSGRST
jgi:hypothetical protein